MSEIDRLNNSGVFPALPVGDKRSEGGSQGRSSPPPRTPQSRQDGAAPDSGASGAPRAPKSLIDEYA